MRSREKDYSVKQKNLKHCFLSFQALRVDFAVGRAAGEDTRRVGARRIGLSGWKEAGTRRIVLQNGE